MRGMVVGEGGRSTGVLLYHRNTNLGIAGESSFSAASELTQKVPTLG